MSLTFLINRSFYTPLPQARAVVGSLLVVVLIGMTGCHSDKTDNAQSRCPVQREASKGPVSMTVRADAAELRVAEPLTMTIDVKADKNVRVTLPEIGKTLGEFRVLRYHDAPDVPAGQGRLWQRTVELESRKSGKLQIPAQAVVFEDQRDPAKPIHGEVKIDPIDVQVVSVLEGRADPRKFRDIKGTIELLPETDTTWVYVAAGGAGGALLLATAAVVLVRRRRNRAVTAQAWALKQLDKLAHSKLLKAGLQRQYYYRLSDIVRQYIERRFDLHASRETTAEFLADMQNQSLLSEEHKGFLRTFLEAADMAKYACYQPDPAETQAVLDSARTFIVSSAQQADEAAQAARKHRKPRRAKNEKEMVRA